MKTLHKLNNILLGLFAFLLLSFVFISTSYANADIFKEGQTLLTKKDYCGATKTTSTLPSYVEGASQAEQRKFIMSTLYDYFNNRTNVDYDFTNFNHLIDTSLNYYSDLYSKNYNGYYILADSIGSTAYSSTFKLYFYQKNDIDILYDKIASVSGTYHQSVSFIDGSDFIFINLYSSGFSSNYYENAIGNCFFRLNQYYQKYSFSSNTSIKQSDTSVMDGSESNTYIFTWDGTSYYQYIDDSDTPTFPTNQEITSIIQKFYDSDYYKNNKNFSDFFVVYYTHNQTFAFIGHTLPTNIDQVKIPAHMKYNGKVYGENWWKFKGDETVSSTDLGSLFYLYTTEDFGDTFQNDGVGRIYELFDLDFSTNANIVYSTQEYKVITFDLDETTGSYIENSTVNNGQDNIISDELTPTINPFNPFASSIEGSASETIISNANMEELKNKFEEFKHLFIFGENMQWLISANNKLSNYFIGFIVMCAWFFAIGRILKG